jgi:hypothetical protein
MNVRLGCEISGAWRTKRGLNGALRARATRNEVKTITPSITGGIVSKTGQTWPPYTVKAAMANAYWIIVRIITPPDLFLIIHSSALKDLIFTQDVIFLRAE